MQPQEVNSFLLPYTCIYMQVAPVKQCNNFVLTCKRNKKVMRCFNYISLVWFSVFYSSGANAQPLSFLKELKMEHITTEQGLSGNIITKILQDRKGFIWILTSQGLNRYDGYRFKFYGYNAKDSNSITPGWFDGAIDNKMK